MSIDPELSTVVSRRSSSSSKTKTFLFGTAIVLLALTVLVTPVAADYGCPFFPDDCPVNCRRFGFKDGACGGWAGLRQCIPY
ncbi:MAG: hypothetical protein JOS17DRAFT_786906 [Linnemannia elongata]|nr:MAG: hypothetical protein JOS17DRAFT_786906 [Linnemannia elongata]